ncbi:hypothetical protein NQD34_015105 [Periophthalmus magnuspinnatus]|nr:hypothetical protein NQD34_015105 [Periophthalmus magnuspinnatus]
MTDNIRPRRISYGLFAYCHRAGYVGLSLGNGLVQQYVDNAGGGRSRNKQKKKMGRGAVARRLVTDVLFVSVYLYGKTNALLTSRCHMPSSCASRYRHSSANELC